MIFINNCSSIRSSYSASSSSSMRIRNNIILNSLSAPSFSSKKLLPVRGTISTDSSSSSGNVVAATAGPAADPPKRRMKFYSAISSGKGTLRESVFETFSILEKKIKNPDICFVFASSRLNEQDSKADNDDEDDDDQVGDDNEEGKALSGKKKEESAEEDEDAFYQLHKEIVKLRSEAKSSDSSFVPKNIIGIQTLAPLFPLPVFRQDAHSSGEKKAGYEDEEDEALFDKRLTVMKIIEAFPNRNAVVTVAASFPDDVRVVPFSLKTESIPVRESFLKHP